MIPNPILYNDDTMMIGIAICCLVAFSIIMVPKAIRYRKNMKENENIIPNDKDQKIEMKIVGANKKTKQNEKRPCYRDIFLSVPKINDRKTVFISKDHWEKIALIVHRLGTRKSSVSGFIENLVIQHLEEYKNEINELHNHSKDELL